MQLSTNPNGKYWGFGQYRQFQPQSGQATGAAKIEKPSIDQDLLKRLQAQYGRLTGQASNALYGGILGYNPQPMTALGGQQFAAPQGNLQSPFAQMQGILGSTQRPQFGGMGQMMQPRFNMGG